jgi:RNA polymerase sigma-32 factor
MATKIPRIAQDSRGLARYMQEIRKFPMLEPGEEFMLAKRWQEHADQDAAEKLVTSHLRLVARIAMGYRGYGLQIGEVVSEGNVGLMQASASPRTPCGGSAPRSRNTSCARGAS